jgi:hypothetical protein
MTHNDAKSTHTTPAATAPSRLPVKELRKMAGLKPTQDDAKRRKRVQSDTGKNDVPFWT